MFRSAIASENASNTSPSGAMSPSAVCDLVISVLSVVSLASDNGSVVTTARTATSVASAEITSNGSAVSTMRLSIAENKTAS